MNWVKKGLIYAPSGKHGWDRQYAHLPTAEVLDSRTLRIYFAALDEHRYGRIGYVDLDTENPSRILNVAPETVLDIGEPGTFDDSGVNPSCIVSMSGTKYLYYIGWQRAERVPYMLFAGVAASDDGTRFRKLSRTPVLDRTADEPFLRSAVTIIAENGFLRCWYVSALRWTQVRDTMYPEYIVRYAESVDGLTWKAYRHICIALDEEEEFGIGRPWVVKDDGVYRMWYSIRSRSAPYRIGYADSKDGIIWNRKDDECNIPRSDTGWDSGMICYPCVIDIGSKRHLFYNGNQHGASGFGYAVLEDADDSHAD